MCGIVYVKRKDKKPAHKQVLKRYTKQKERGQEGFGYVALDIQNRVSSFKRFQKEKDARTALEKSISTHVLFHHRYPTSTPNIPESAHPILVSHRELSHDYYVVHNGVLRNDDELKIAHEKLGYRYTTEVQTVYQAGKTRYIGAKMHNDSEALAIELARNIDGITADCKATGTIAYIVMQVQKSNKKAIALYYGTNGGNPLTVSSNDNGIVIASQGGTPVIGDRCYRLDLQTDETTIATHVTMASYYTPKVGYFANTLSSWQDDEDDVIYAGDYSALSADELAEELEEIQTRIEEVEADISIAQQAGESIERDELQVELSGIIAQRDWLQKIYAKKSTALLF